MQWLNELTWKKLKLYEIGMLEIVEFFWLCSRAQRRWTLNTTKAHSIFGTHHKQMDCFGKLACVIRYHCAVCAISTVSGEWLQDMCTQGYVNTVINLVV